MENRKEEKVTLFPRRLFLRLAALALAAVLVLGLTACDSLPDSGGHTVKPSTICLNFLKKSFDRS